MERAMTGLPEITSTTRRRPVWDAFVIGGLERLTESLMRGNEVPEADLDDMRKLRSRCEAFSAALSARERAAGVA